MTTYYDEAVTESQNIEELDSSEELMAKQNQNQVDDSSELMS